MRDDYELLRYAACCTALISAFLDNIDGTFSVKGESDMRNAGFGGPAETSEETTIGRDEPAVEQIYT